MELRILRNLKKGPYVEFNSTGKNWDNSSLFLDEAVFGVFADCFYASNAKFNYYGPTLYQESALLKLQSELDRFNSLLSEITDFQSFAKAISGLPTGNNFLGELEASDKVDLNLKWSEVLVALKEIGATLLGLVQKYANENGVLWVLGI
jgi:hypothetical protein